MHFFIVYFMKKVCREPLVKLAPEKTLAILPSWAQGAPPTVPHTVKTVATPSIFDRNGPHDTLDGPEASISAGITRWYNFFDQCGSPLDISLEMSSTTQLSSPPRRGAPRTLPRAPGSFPGHILRVYWPHIHIKALMSRICAINGALSPPPLSPATTTLRGAEIFISHRFLLLSNGRSYLALIKINCGM